MSTPDPAVEPAPPSATAGTPAPAVVPALSAADDAGAGVQSGPELQGEAERVPVIVASEQQVTLQRSVRYGRVLVGAMVIGAALASLACVFFPIVEGSDYTMGQAIGFMAVMGAAIGLGIGAILSLVLGAVAKRQHGAGVAIQTDVR